jgi:hypothetical protein
MFLKEKKGDLSLLFFEEHLTSRSWALALDKYPVRKNIYVLILEQSRIVPSQNGQAVSTTSPLFKSYANPSTTKSGTSFIIS